MWVCRCDEVCLRGGLKGTNLSTKRLGCRTSCEDVSCESAKMGFCCKYMGSRSKADAKGNDRK